VRRVRASGAPAFGACRLRDGGNRRVLRGAATTNDVIGRIPDDFPIDHVLLEAPEGTIFVREDLQVAGMWHRPGA